MNTKSIFIASCIALLTTSMTFAIRAGILVQLGTEFNLNSTELGWINGMAFLGFPLATILGGLLYNSIGAKTIIKFAFFSHVCGILLTVFSGGFWGLLISTFLIGFANGSVEAACNPLIAQIYKDKKTEMLNKFHVWFPGGIVIGSLLSFFLTGINVDWKFQVSIILLPALIYGYMIYKLSFPNFILESGNTRKNFSNLFTPLFIFFMFCMTLTATTELGTQQWVEKILSNSGAHPMLILALITGIMAIGRYFAGPVIHRLNPIGILFVSSVIATIALGVLSMANGYMVYVGAIIFACGVMYFWPTMLGSVAELLPQTGALGLSVVGAAGMFGTFVWQPIIGSWLDNERIKAISSGLSNEAADLAAGQATLDNLAIFPAVLILLFGILYQRLRKRR